MRASQLCHEDVSHLAMAETESTNLTTRQSIGAMDIEVSPLFWLEMYRLSRGCGDRVCITYPANGCRDDRHSMYLKG